MRVEIVDGNLSEDFGMTMGTVVKISFPMYFYNYRKVKNGVILNVCTRDELIENHFDIAEYLCEECQYILDEDEDDE